MKTTNLMLERNLSKARLAYETRNVELSKEAHNEELTIVSKRR